MDVSDSSLNLSNTPNIKQAFHNQSSISPDRTNYPPIRTTKKEKTFTATPGKYSDELIDPSSAHLQRSETSKTRSINRLQTINTFTSRDRFFDDAPKTGQKKPNILQNQIYSNDGTSSVKAIVSKSKNDCFRRKKELIKGTMYVNDLWGKEYQKTITKHAQISTGVIDRGNTPLNLLDAGFQQQNQLLLTIANTPKLSKDTVRVKTASSMLQASQSANGSVLKKLVFKKAPHTTMKDNQTERLRNTYMPEISEDHKLDSYHLRESHPQLKMNRSLTKLHQNSQPIKNHRDQSIRTSHSTRNLTRTEGSLTFENSNSRDLTRTHSRNWDRLQDQPRSTRILEESSFTKKRMISLNRLKGKSLKRDSLSYKVEESPIKEFETLDARRFLYGTNNQFNELIGDCENELKGRNKLGVLIENIQGLFSHKEERMRKKEDLQKTQLIEECQILMRRNERNRTIKN